MNILLTGAHGQVGWELARALPALGKVVATDHNTLDLGDPDAIRRMMRELKPEMIFNAGGYTAVDKAESEPELAMRVNAAGPGVLGEEAKRLGALLVHYSSDYVFDGEKRSPYAEGDEANPLMQYGHSKLAGERAIATTGCRHLILRTSWVYGPRASNFYQLIRRKAEANEPFAMADDNTSVPTPASFLVEQTLALVKRQATGLLQLVPSGQATRYEFALAVVNAMGSGSKVERGRTSDFPAPAQRPAYSVMSNANAAGILGQAIPDWNKIGPLQGGST